MADMNATVRITEKGARETIASLTKLRNALLATSQGAGLIEAAYGGQTKASKEVVASSNAVAKSVDNAAKAQQNYWWHISKTTVTSALVNKAFLGLTNSMSKAVEQIDTIENFPAVMSAFGISTVESTKGMARLQGYVNSVGADLNQATQSVARFAQTNKSVTASVAMYAGVNNALQAGGTAAVTQAAALEQLTQAYAKGKFDGEEFKSVNTAMGAAMAETAKQMELPNTQALQDALNKGTISMNEFMVKLTEVSTTGSIADAAIANMTGVGFAMNVMSNTLTNGLTAIYQAVGRQNIIHFFNFLTGVIMTLAQWVVVLTNAFRWLWATLTGQKFSAIVGDTADSLKEGAGAANDMGKGLDGANKSAKKLRNQLASFDKMNVLTEPTDSDKDSGGSGTGGMFDQGQMDAMQGVFDNLPNGLKEASLWAKILAGILVGLATNAAIARLFGVNPLQGLINGIKGIGSSSANATKDMDELGKATDRVGKKEVKPGLKIDQKSWVDKITAPFVIAIPGIGKGFSKLGPLLTRMTPALFSPVGAAIAITIVAALPFIIDNWENIVEIMKRMWDGFVIFLGQIMGPAIESLGKAWDGLMDTMQPVIDAIKLAWGGLMDAISPFTNWIGEMYETYIKPFVDEIVRWWQENVTLASTLETIGTIIGVAVLGAIGAVLAVIALVVVAFVAVVAAVVWVIAKIVEFANYFISGSLYNDIASFFTNIGEWIKTKFSEAWDFIVGIWSSVAAWFDQNVIQPLANFFTGLWEGIKKVFSVVGTWLGDQFKKGVDNVKNFWSGIGGWFSGKWNEIKNVFGPVAGWLGSQFRQGWENIKRAFGGVASFFQGIWNTITRLFGNIGGAIGDAVSGAFRNVVNGILGFIDRMIGNVVDGINRMIGMVGKVVPGVGSLRLYKPYIPRLATGGVVNRPTIAEIGEAGAEAVVPLENNTEWLDKIADRLDSALSTRQPSGPDMLADTRDRKGSELPPITINLSGVFATSEQEKRKVAEEIYKYIKKAERAKGSRV